MIKLVTSTCAILIILTLTAIAGPIGDFYVNGTSPGGGSNYSGIVSVRQTGQTYSVVWDIAGEQFVGTGIGAANIDGFSTMGPANPKDNAIAISYASGSSFGLAYYVEQKDGTWKGIWTYAGSKEISTEVWQRR